MDEPIVVIVTEPEFRKAEPAFGRASEIRCVAAPADEQQLAAAIRDAQAQAAIVGVQPYRGALYAALPRGGVISRFGVGHDGIDKVQATRAGILCTNTPGVLEQSVAELTMLLVLAAARHLPEVTARMTAGDWGARIGTEVRGKSLAVIGRGRIGTAVMQLAGAFGMQVVCAGRNDDFGIAASDADFISLHLPSNMDTHHFLNRDTLAVLSPHAWIINTARGSVVDENALYDALAGGQIAGAALDVFDREPYQPADPSRDLRRLPNVILTPHIGSNTAEANARMAARALKNVRFGMAKEYAAMDLLNQDVRAMLETGDAGSGGPMR